VSARGPLLVTGGSRGIGAAIGRRAAAAGYDVALTYAHERSAAEALVAEIVASGRRAVAIQADVAREDDVLRAFHTLDVTFGPLAALVNNAGISGGFSRVAEVTHAQLERVMAVNVIGAMLCAREAVRRMSSAYGGRGGAIVNVTSKAARIGSAGEWVHYAASKGALETFTLGLAREVAEEGIRVNAVAPGLVETDLHAAAGDPERPARMASGIPMRRAGDPDEIAAAVTWLLSDEASYVTGAVLDVTGGR
jgi:NAD(P)-dependent dehydrogenase (short-subunit alcohol dehydrogenase family)